MNKKLLQIASAQNINEGGIKLNDFNLVQSSTYVAHNEKNQFDVRRCRE